jgi:hypothetical protein
MWATSSSQVPRLGCRESWLSEHCKEKFLMEKCYIASGWFSPEWEKEVESIKATLDSVGCKYFSPKDFFVCPPDATADVQQATYDGNLRHLHECDWMLCNTRNKDMGTIFEAGYFKGLVYFCDGLRGNFNLMLSRSGVKVCTSIAELEDYLTRSQAAGELLVEEYSGRIE